MEQKGKITKVTEFEGGRYSYRVEDNYYSGFGKPEFKEGENVIIDYKVNTGTDGKQYRNIQKVYVGEHNQLLTEKLYDPESSNKKLKETVIEAHKWAFDEVCKIIGREPTGQEFTFVNSMIVNYLKNAILEK
mgnify:CR=1 FL=1